MWTQTYKEFLETLLQGTDKQEAILKDYKEYHTDTQVHFRIEFLEGNLKKLISGGTFETKMKLTSKISVSNMTLFDAEGRIKKYANPEEIVKEFYDLRLKYYEKRKDYLVNELNEHWSMLDNKVRFILAVIKEEIVIRNRKRADLLKELDTKKFAPFYKKRDPKKAKTAKDDGKISRFFEKLIILKDEEEEDDDEDTKKTKKENNSNSSSNIFSSNVLLINNKLDMNTCWVCHYGV
jgi:DNA topoisomerase-2